MKPVKILCLVFTFLATTAYAHAGLYFAGDIYSEGGIADGYDKDAKEVVDILNDAGVYAWSDTTASLGIGARVGARVARETGSELGLSLGVIRAPVILLNAVNGPFMIGSDSYGSGTLDIDVDVHFLRPLVEGAVPLIRSGQLSFMLAGGLGLALGKAKQDVAATGGAAALFKSGSYSESWSGLTWEISPTLVLHGEKAQLEAGIRYSHFPKLKETDDFSEIAWDPVSVFFGVRFR